MKMWADRRYIVSLARQSEIKADLEACHRDISDCLTNFQVGSGWLFPVAMVQAYTLGRLPRTSKFITGTPNSQLTKNVIMTNSCNSWEIQKNLKKSAMKFSGKVTTRH